MYVFLPSNDDLALVDRACILQPSAGEVVADSLYLRRSRAPTRGGVEMLSSAPQRTSRNVCYIHHPHPHGSATWVAHLHYSTSSCSKMASLSMPTELRLLAQTRTRSCKKMACFIMPTNLRYLAQAGDSSCGHVAEGPCQSSCRPEAADE